MGEIEHSGVVSCRGRLPSGSRLSLRGRFLSRRGLSCEGHRIHRLLFESPQLGQVPVLVSPHREPLFDLRTGEVYHLQRLCWCRPATTDARTVTCSECGDPVAPGTPDDLHAAVRTALGRLKAADGAGIADADTRVRPTDTSTPPVAIVSPPRRDDPTCHECGSSRGDNRR